MKEYTSAWSLANSRNTRPQGIESLKKLTELHPDNWRPSYALAKALMYARSLDSGIAYFESQVREHPSWAFPHLGLSVIHGFRNNHVLALAESAKCVEKDPTASPCFVKWAQNTIAVDGQRVPLSLAARKLPMFRTSPYACVARTAFAYLARDLRTHAIEREACYVVSKTHGDPRLRAYIRFEHYIDATGMLVPESEFANDMDEALALIEQSNDLQVYSLLLSVHIDRAFRAKAFQAATRLSERRENLSERLGNREQIDARGQKARLVTAQGDLEDAVAQWQRAAEVDQEEQNQDIGIFLSLAGALRRAGRATDSLSTLDKAFKASARDSDKAFCLRMRSIVQYEMGDYWKALKDGHESIRLFRRDRMSWQAGAGEGNLPDIYLSLGMNAKALHFAYRAVQSGRQHGDVGEVKRNLAVVGSIRLRMGSPRLALAAFDEALSIKWDYLGNFSADALLGKASALQALRRYREAHEALDQVMAHALASGHKLLEATALHAIAELETAENRLDSAQVSYQQCMDIAAMFEHPELVLACRHGLAGVAGKRGNHALQWAYIEPSLTVLNGLRSRIPTPDLRQAFQGQNARIFEDAIDALLCLHRASPDAGWDRKAFTVAEQGRARVLYDLISENRYQIGRGLSASQKRKKDELEQAVSLALGTLMANTTPENKLRVNNAEQALSDWVEQTRTASPEYINARYPHPASIDAAEQLARRQGITIFMYTLGSRSSALWIVSAGATRIVEMPSAPVVERKVKRFLESVRAHPKGPSNYAQVSRQLFDVLVAPALGTARTPDNLLIIPDGILHYLPFEALVGPDGKFLVEKSTVTYTPSLSTFVALDQSAANAEKLLAYGDPAPLRSSTDASGKPSLLVRGVLRDAGLMLPPLPNTRVEIRQIAKTFSASQSTLRVGPDATEASVKDDDLTRYGNIHFATHALIDERAPSRSGIVLDLTSPGREDGVLRAAEILNLRLKANLVVLSACQTGLGTLVRGEGMMGLTRSFLAAGAKRVIVSLWAVNDLATSDLMTRFYELRSKFPSNAEALRGVKLEMIRSERTAYRHPYFWAGFVQTGAR